MRASFGAEDGRAESAVLLTYLLGFAVAGCIAALI